MSAFAQQRTLRRPVRRVIHASMVPSTFEEAESRIIGLTCRVERADFNWFFVFEHVCTIGVDCPWRLLGRERVVLAIGDDGQQYGLPEPIDCETRANSLLQGGRVVKWKFLEASADLVILFDNGVALQTFANSIGYESWQANFGAHDGISLIVGMGGGGFSVL